MSCGISESYQDHIRQNINGEIMAFEGKAHRGNGGELDSVLHMLKARRLKPATCLVAVSSRQEQ